MSTRRFANGFTIIELMVAVAVIVILLLLGLPSFQGTRQRSALRGASEHLVSFWNQARMEAAKRNKMVKVGLVQSGSGATFCLGAATTTDPADATPCDCTTAAPATQSTTCDVARFPDDNGEWKGSTLSGVTIGTSNWPTVATLKPVVIEPKRTSLTVPGNVGTITLAGPPGRRAYLLRMNVDQMGRAVLCEPTSATSKMSDFGGRRCP